MKKSKVLLGLILVCILIVGAMTAMATDYTTAKNTNRAIYNDDGAANKHNCGYYQGSWQPSDDATCWAEGSGTSGYSRYLYAKMSTGEGRTYDTNCTGYSNNYSVYSESLTGLDKDTGVCEAHVNNTGNKLTITN